MLYCDVKTIKIIVLVCTKKAISHLINRFLISIKVLIIIYLKIWFLRSETCEGHYCFVSMTTSELVLEGRNESNNEIINYMGVIKPSYEILAGCLKVDDDKVRIF